MKSKDLLTSHVLKAVFLLAVSCIFISKNYGQIQLSDFPSPDELMKVEYGSTTLQKYESKASALFTIGTVIRRLNRVTQSSQLSDELRNFVDKYNEKGEAVYDLYKTKVNDPIDIDTWIADIKKLRADEDFRQFMFTKLPPQVKEEFDARKEGVKASKRAKMLNLLMGIGVILLAIFIFIKNARAASKLDEKEFDNTNEHGVVGFESHKDLRKHQLKKGYYQLRFYFAVILLIAGVAFTVAAIRLML